MDNPEFKLLDSLFEPVLVFNQNNESVYFNHFATSFFQLSPRKMKNAALKTLVGAGVEMIENLIDQCRKEKGSLVSEEFSCEIGGQLKTLVVKANSFSNDLIHLYFNDLSVEKSLYDKYKAQVEELRQTHQQVLQADKVRALGELTAGINHEINNPLTVVWGNAELLGFSFDNEDLNPEREVMQEALGNINEGLERIQTIITNMKEFLHSERKESMEYASYKDVIENSHKFLSPAFKEENVKLELDIKKEKAIGLMNKIKIEQVIVNLAKNSLDALVEAGTENPEVKIALDRPKGSSYIYIDVIDNGPGVPADIKERIFDNFYTTKEVGKGTGLGLSLSKSIIEAHQGTISIEEHSGGWFRVSLPVLEVSSYASNDLLFQTLANQGGKKVLVVDNDVNILNLCHKFFEGEKFLFIGSSNGFDALEILEKIQVDVILTDIMMPEMDGRTFVQEVRKRKVDAPVFYLSSKEKMNIYQEDKDELKVSGLVIKPFTKDELLGTLGN